MGTYADQRAHDVAWMTAAERAALDVPRFAIRATYPCPEHGGHDHQWTYTGITAADAEQIAGQLTAHDRERNGATWTAQAVTR